MIFNPNRAVQVGKLFVIDDKYNNANPKTKVATLWAWLESGNHAPHCYITDMDYMNVLLENHNEHQHMNHHRTDVINYDPTLVMLQLCYLGEKL